RNRPRGECGTVSLFKPTNLSYALEISRVTEDSQTSPGLFTITQYRTSPAHSWGMKVLAIGSIVKPVTPEQRQEIMPKELPDTLKLYLDGKIEQFWARTDKPGVVFLLNTESVEQAKQALGALPLVSGGYAEYEYVPVGPLKPLGLLLQSN